jgi:glutaminyl-peptide cyclotransferase
MSAKKRAANQMNRPNPEARRPKDEPRPAPAQPAPSGKKGILKWILISLVGLLLVAAIWKKIFPPAPKKLPPKPMEQETQWESTVDGARMMKQVERLLAIGPRVAGTEGSRRAQEMIKAELGAAGITDIREQSFTEKTPEGDVKFTNIIGVLPGKQPEGIALAAHYDSKLFKDFHFVGANDAASAVACLFEIARKLKGVADRDFTYYFIFFDGEEAFLEHWDDWKNQTGNEDNTYGSRYFARNMTDATYPIKTLILLDLVGDKDYSLRDDEVNFSRELVAIFKKASVKTFGVDFFVQRGTVGDDHIPFKDLMPVIDIIDFEYRSPTNVEYWHTKEDTIDKLSARSLERTGTLVLAALPEVEAMVRKTVRPASRPETR